MHCLVEQKFLAELCLVRELAWSRWRGLANDVAAPQLRDTFPWT